MDWDKAIALNRAQLIPIVAALFVLAGLVPGGTLARLERPIYRAVLLVLRPAEAAVRLLIVMAARGLTVKLPPPRPMPEGRVIAGKSGDGRGSFKLVDPPKRYGRRRKRKFAKVAPRIIIFDDNPNIPWFLRRPAPPPAPIPEPEPDDGAVDARRLGRRLAAIKAALDDLPRQAERLARWRARQARINPLTHAVASPLRIGRPPGHRQRPRHEVDYILRECHAVAQEALYHNTS